MPGTAAPETLRCLAAGAACMAPCGTGRRAACSQHGGQRSELQCGCVADRNGPGTRPRGTEWGGAASTRADVPRCAARRGAGRTPTAGARLGARRSVIRPNWRTGRGAGVGGTRGGGGREGARDASGHGTSLLPVGRGILAVYRAFSQPTEKWTRGLRKVNFRQPPFRIAPFVCSGPEQSSPPRGGLWPGIPRALPIQQATPGHSCDVPRALSLAPAGTAPRARVVRALCRAGKGGFALAQRTGVGDRVWVRARVQGVSLRNA